MAMPNAAVDLPFISPVCTSEQRPVAPLPRGQPVLRHRLRAVPWAVRPASRAGGRWRPATSAASSSSRSVSAPRARAERAGQPSRTGPLSQSTTTRGVAGRASRPAAARARGDRRRAPPVARPSVTTTSSGRRCGSRDALDAQQLGARSRPAASGVRPPVGSVGQPARRPASTRPGGRERHARRPVAAEGDQADLVAPLVGVEQQRQHGALHRRHPRARSPSSRWRRTTKSDQVALAALERGLAQVLRRRPDRAPAAAAARTAGAARRAWHGGGQVQRRGRGRRAGATPRPRSETRRARAPAGRPAPMPGTSVAVRNGRRTACRPPRRAQRRAAAPSRSSSSLPPPGPRSRALSRTSVAVGATAVRAAAVGGRRAGSSSGPSCPAASVEGLRRASRRRRPGASKGLRRRRCGRASRAATRTSSSVTTSRPRPGGVRDGGAGGDEVGAQAVDVEGGADRGDLAQRVVGEDDARQAGAGVGDPGGQRRPRRPATRRRSRRGRRRRRTGGAPPRRARPGRGGAATSTVSPNRSSSWGRSSPSSGFIVPTSRKRAACRTETPSRST